METYSIPKQLQTRPSSSASREVQIHRSGSEIKRESTL